MNRCAPRMTRCSACRSFPSYDLESCEFIISFGADFLETWISPVEYARQFAQMHSLRDGKIGRMVYVGPRLSMTAANADDFLMVAPGAEHEIALAMLHVMLDEGLVAGRCGGSAEDR